MAQQEVDDAQGKDLAAESQVEAARANLAVGAEPAGMPPRPKRQHDQALFEYSKITAPFDGVVTQRYANLGALMQAGTSSTTQATPLVRLSQDDLFRLVIPVPESYVKYIRVGDPVEVPRALAGSRLHGQGGALLGGRHGRHPHHAHRSGCAESRTGSWFRAFTPKPL